mgnify:CR=1 FL=1|tara:strand:+ start:483 stop:962 length:480 start_codon:yes stop_codon:yes gene_type:complete
MAKKTTKKKFSFKNMFNPKPQTVSEGYAQYTGMQIAAGGGPPGSEKFTASKKTTFGLKQAKDDFLMDIGVKKKGIDYYARLDDRRKRSQQAMKEMQERIRKGDDGPSRPRGETAAERRARLKEEELAKRKAKGQERRRKFYKQKDERLAKLKAKLLNLA